MSLQHVLKRVFSIVADTVQTDEPIIFSTVPLVPVDSQGASLLRQFLRSGGTMDRQGIESLLFEVKRGDEIKGRAVHIGNGYFLTALHVIELDNLRLAPQVTSPYNQYDVPFEVAYSEVDTDLALLKAPYEKKEDAPLVRLYRKIPEVKDIVSQFVSLDGNVSTKDFEFQYDEPGTSQRVRKLIIPQNSQLVEKQGEVRYNRENPPVNGSRFIDYCFDTSMPCERGDSGGGVFLKVGHNKYAFIGIVTRMSGVRRSIALGNIPDYAFYTGNLVIDREPIEKLIRKYLSVSHRIRYQPSQ